MQTVEEVLEKLNDVIRQNKEDLRKTRTEYEGTIRACLKDCERADEEIKRLKGLSDYEKNALDHPAMMQMAEEHLAETEQMAERINSLQSQLAASQERERILREGLEEYAQTRNWARAEMDCQYRNLWMRWENGYDIAERTIKAAEEVKGCTGK